MIEVEFSPTSNVAILKPSGHLTEADFERVAEILDPQIENFGRLEGLIIMTRAFPFWETFGALLRHVRFVRNHHRSIEKVAIVTDSFFGDLAEHIASHVVSARVHHFGFDELAAAEAWICNEGDGE